MIWQFDLIFYHDAIVAQNLFLLNFRLLLINMHIILSLNFYIILQYRSGFISQSAIR